MGRRRHAYTNGRGGRTKEYRQYPADRDDRLTLPPALRWGFARGAQEHPSRAAGIGGPLAYLDGRRTHLVGGAQEAARHFLCTVDR